VKGWTSICNGTADEILALIAVRAREEIVARNLGIIEANRELLDGFFARNADRFEWVRPEAGCLAFPRFRSGDAEPEAKRLARDHRTLLLPGRLFFGGAAHFRLGYGRTNLSTALRAL
jgi:aspartate/methionine/tyrosine aminotransferase